MNPNPKPHASPDGRMMHITEAAYLDPAWEHKEKLRIAADKLLAEIKSIDEQISGLGMTPEWRRQARFDDLSVRRSDKVKGYKKLKVEFNSLAAAPAK